MCALALVLFAGAAEAAEIPRLTARVMDRAQLLSASERDALERELAEFEARVGHTIVVHTTPSLEGLEIEAYSIEIADAWKIGDQKLDNGVILTVAPNERRMRIETGYGLEGVLPDALAKRIIEEQIAPEFRAGRLGDGIRAGVQAIEAVIAREPVPAATREPRRGPRSMAPGFWILIVLISLIHFLGGGLRRSGRAPGRMPRASWGGGFGGRGGGFGGGGASGRW